MRFTRESLCFYLELELLHSWFFFPELKCTWVNTRSSNEKRPFVSHCLFLGYWLCFVVRDWEFRCSVRRLRPAVQDDGEADDEHVRWPFRMTLRDDRFAKRHHMKCVILRRRSSRSVIATSLRHPSKKVITRSVLTSQMQQLLLLNNRNAWTIYGN